MITTTVIIYAHMCVYTYTYYCTLSGKRVTILLMDEILHRFS